MGPNFTKFVTTGSVWEENLRLAILWKNYGNTVPYASHSNQNSHNCPLLCSVLSLDSLGILKLVQVISPVRTVHQGMNKFHCLFEADMSSVT